MVQSIVFMSIVASAQFGSSFHFFGTNVVGPHLSVLKMSSEDGLGAARAMLFHDQHKVMGQQAEIERELLEPNMLEMELPEKNNIKKKKRNRGAGAAAGFGGKSAKLPKLTKMEKVTALRKKALEDDGTVLVPSVLSRETAENLRGCIYAELEHMREDVRQDASKSESYFFVPPEIHFSTPRGYVLLPFRDADSVAAGLSNIGTIVNAARELLAPEAPLAALFGAALDGPRSQLYDFCAIRTEPGSARQQVHYDTPYQETPGLFCVFVALHDVTMEMGGTLFIPGTHTLTKERKSFDDGDTDERNEMLRQAKPRYTMLKAGDAAFFDMRTLHCGLPNLEAKNGGAPRLMLILTFRNLEAKANLGHKPNLRPGYVGTHTLESFQKELASETPFVNSGNGVLVE